MLENENQTNQKKEEQNLNGNENDYIKAMQELKENSVPKEDYLKLKEENKRLINAFANGEENPLTNNKKDAPDINALRVALTKEDQTNLEFCQNALNLRNALLDIGKEDPFLPKGHLIKPTDEDRQKAQNVADVFQDCIDYAQGDSEAFTNELMRRTENDDMRLTRRLNKKKDK